MRSLARRPLFVLLLSSLLAAGTVVAIAASDRPRALWHALEQLQPQWLLYALAAELVALKVDVIVTVGSAVVAATQATSVIPIVFAAAVDPLGSGLVASLARPGGNVTGLSMQSTEMAGKRLELLREVLPDLRRLAVIGNANYPAAVLEIGEVQAAGRTIGIEVDKFQIRGAEDIAPAFKVLRAGRRLCTSVPTRC